MRSLLFLAATSLFAVSSAAAQSVAGEWNASYETPGGPKAFKVVLVVNGDKLSGTVKRETGDVPLVGTIKADSVKFTYSINYNDHPMEMNVAAKVTGDAMKGLVDFAGQAQEVFQATRPTADKKPAPGSR